MTDSQNIELLQKKLKHAQEWMAREIENAEQVRKNKLIKDNATIIGKEFNVTQKIQYFLEDFSPQDIPQGTIENIRSSEILFEHILEGYHLDGTAVIVGYQKVLDLLVEIKITEGFRKFIQEKGISHAPENKVLEKSFYAINANHYTLGLGRLYQALQKIKNNKIDGLYLLHFSQYIHSHSSLKKSLLESDFFLQLEQLVNSNAVGEKRHQGSLSLQDTKICRELCIGNLYEKNCLIYILLNTD
ncbi:hypothetical protein GW846_05850 [Candidatus Gracilibacteria bacterium]|nr:hypothetical protein [Candidatus Gracilibacteria bacterium]